MKDSFGGPIESKGNRASHQKYAGINGGFKGAKNETALVDRIGTAFIYEVILSSTVLDRDLW